MPPAVFSRWILLRLQLFSQKRRRLRKKGSLNSTKRLTSLTELSRTRSGWARSRRILDRTMSQVCISLGSESTHESFHCSATKIAGAGQVPAALGPSHLG